MSNQLDEDSVEHMLNFYQSLLEDEIREEARYQSHLYIGLLLWRKNGQVAIDEISNHFLEASKITVDILEQNSAVSDMTVQDVIQFQYPAFIIYLFGDFKTRQKLINTPRQPWNPREANGMQSFVGVVDLVCSGMVSRQFEEDDIRAVINSHKHYAGHPSYEPWISLFLQALLHISKKQVSAVENACRELLELHLEETLHGDWQSEIQAMIAIWPLLAVTIAEQNDITVDLKSPYIPQI